MTTHTAVSEAGKEREKKKAEAKVRAGMRKARRDESIDGKAGVAVAVESLAGMNREGLDTLVTAIWGRKSHASVTDDQIREALTEYAGRGARGKVEAVKKTAQKVAPQPEKAKPRQGAEGQFIGKKEGPALKDLPKKEGEKEKGEGKARIVNAHGQTRLEYITELLKKNEEKKWPDEKLLAKWDAEFPDTGIGTGWMTIATVRGWFNGDAEAGKRGLAGLKSKKHEAVS